MSDFKRTIRLRPHHGLCMQFFRGEGYSIDFVLNMEGIIEQLENGAQLVLTDGADDICAACPHNRGGVCDSEQKVRRFDFAVLHLCGLAPGKETDWATFGEAARKHIISCGRLYEICGDCEWAYICDALTLPIREN